MATSTDTKWKIAFLIFLIGTLSLVIWATESSGTQIISTSTTTQKPKKDCSTLGYEWIDARSVNFSCIGIFDQTPKSYLEAYNFCANLDSHLVEIFTKTQQDFLKAKLEAKFRNRRYMHFWIGVKFNHVNWYWEHSNTGLKFNGFQDCYDGPPDCIKDYNDAENAEPYAHMDQEKGYKWDDEDEDDANTYPICQYND